MGLFNHFPYVNFHELNLDWLLKETKSLQERVQKIEDTLQRELVYHVSLEAGDTLDIEYTGSTVQEILLAGNSDNNCGQIMMHSRDSGAIYYDLQGGSDITVSVSTHHLTITPGTKRTLVYVYNIYGAETDYSVTLNPNRNLRDLNEDINER